MTLIRYTYGRDIAKHGSDPVEVTAAQAKAIVKLRRAVIVEQPEATAETEAKPATASMKRAAKKTAPAKPTEPEPAETTEATSDADADADDEASEREPVDKASRIWGAR